MIKQYVSDTNSIIWYFEHVFEETSQLSASAKRILEQAFDKESDVRLTIPSIVFVEIRIKWYTSDELAAKIAYEVYRPIRDSDNITIRGINDEVLENLMDIKGALTNHDLHDKIVLANAMMLRCPLLTSDHDIKKYVAQTAVIPSVI